MRIISRFLTAIVITVLGFSAAYAQAAGSWLPSYNSNQHVYIAPAVGFNVRSQFNSSQFQAEIDQAARAQSIDVYVIVTQNGSDLTDTGASSGPVLVRKVWDKWSSDSRIASGRSLIILMTGNGDGKLTSVGVRAGGALNALGIMRDTMNDRNGPVMPVLRNYLDNTPAAVPAKIVTNIAKIVEAKTGKSAVLSEPTSFTGGNGTTTTTTTTSPNLDSPPQHSNNAMLGIALIVLVGVGAALYFFTRKPREEARDFETRMRSSTTSRSSLSDGPAVTPSSTPTAAPTPTSGSSFGRDAAMLGAGALGGYALGSEVARRREEERRRSDDSSSSSSSYTPAPAYTPPASSCSSSTSSSSCSSSSGGSSCGGGGSSCGGGGSSCGGGS